MEADKHKKVLLRIDETNNALNRNETFTKTERKRITEKISRNKPRTDPGKTNFREVADRRARHEDSGPLMSSPQSWYIPSEPNSRSGSSELIEEDSPKARRSEGSQANVRGRTSSVSNQQNFGWNGQQSKAKNRHFGQTYPSRQPSLDSEIPTSQCRGIQTGSSLLRMYLRKV